MERDRKIEKEFIKELANVEQNEKFIISSLHLMDNDLKRKQLIDYIKSKPNITRKEVETKMFYITIG